MCTCNPSAGDSVCVCVQGTTGRSLELSLAKLRSARAVRASVTIEEDTYRRPLPGLGVCEPAYTHSHILGTCIWTLGPRFGEAMEPLRGRSNWKKSLRFTAWPCSFPVPFASWLAYAYMSSFMRLLPCLPHQD